MPPWYPRLRPCKKLRSVVNATSRPQVGAQHQLNAHYFRRIDALNFSMMHDDGQHTDDLDAADVVLIPATTALYRLAPPSFLAGYTFEFKVGQRLDEAQLKSQLTLAGYQHVTQVVSPGEYAVRGGLIDLFPMGSPIPLRVDLFDDEIDSIRTFDPAVRSSLLADFETLIRNTSAAHGVTPELGWLDACPPTMNDPNMAVLARNAASEALGSQNLRTSNPSMGGEDFAFFLEKVPGAYFWLGLGMDRGPLHNPRFDFNDETLAAGIAVFAGIIANYCKSA